MNSRALTRIGVFDSGVGGLSVLRALGDHLPQADLHYVADSGHAPYGERPDAYVIDRSLCIAEHLLRNGATALVVACNTATAVAGRVLRDAWPRVPIVGVEPGLKPAARLSRSKRIGVMATGATLRSDKFRRLLDAHAGGAHVHLQACTGLAAAIEAGDLNDPALIDLVERHCEPLRAAQVDVAVLGCTHYPFVRELIQRAMGREVLILDTAEAVARRALVVCGALEATADVAAKGRIELETSGDVTRLRRIAADWLGFNGNVSALPALEGAGARDGA